MRASLLDWGHHRHLYVTGDADFNRVDGYLWNLCSCVCDFLGVCVLEGARDKRHATWSDCWVLCSWSKAGYCSKEWLNAGEALNTLLGDSALLPPFIWDEYFCGSVDILMVEQFSLIISNCNYHGALPLFLVYKFSCYIIGGRNRMISHNILLFLTY